MHHKVKYNSWWSIFKKEKERREDTQIEMGETSKVACEEPPSFNSDTSIYTIHMRGGEFDSEVEDSREREWKKKVSLFNFPTILFYFFFNFCSITNPHVNWWKLIYVSSYFIIIIFFLLPYSCILMWLFIYVLHIHIPLLSNSV